MNFYGVMSILAAVVIVAGFGNTYPSHVMSGQPISPIIHLHAAVFLAWLVFFIAQTVLIRQRKIKQHQQVGNAGMVLAGLMLVMGVMTTLTVVRLGHIGVPGVEFPDPEGFLWLNVDVLVVFGVLVAAGWVFRKKPQAHKRLMLMATIGGLMPPGISRLPFVAGHTPAIGVIVVLFVLTPLIHDLVTRRRIHPAYVFAFVVCIFGFPPVASALSTLPAWHRMAQAMIG